MLYYKLPFYGKRGSIGEIKESKSGVEVFFYDVDGKINDNIMTIRNTFNNKRDLLANFFSDVEEYLVKNQNKFLELKSKKQKNVLNKKKAICILVISILLGIGIPTFGVVFGNFGLSYASIIALAMGASFSTASIISLKNGKENDNINNFLNIYSNLSHELKIYKEEKMLLSNNSKKIKSRGLSPSVHDKDKNSILIKTRKQELDRMIK